MVTFEPITIVIMVMVIIITAIKNNINQKKLYIIRNIYIERDRHTYIHIKQYI